MIEFKGSLSDEIRQKEIKKQSISASIKFIIGTIISAVLLGVVLVIKYTMSKSKPTFKDLFSDEILLFFVLLFVVLTIFMIISFIKPSYNKELDKTSPFSVKFDNDKIVYEPTEGFGKREIKYSNLKKIVDYGSYYIIVSKEDNIQLICEKALLVQGSLKEFDEYFNKIISRKVEKTEEEIEPVKEKEKVLNAEAKKGEINKTEDATDDEKAEDGADATKIDEKAKGAKEVKEESAIEEKTFVNAKFKKSRTKNEKSFKFALIGIILAVASVAVTPLVVYYGIHFAISAITHIFNSLFYGGFVRELFTFLFACIGVLISTVALFLGCVLIMPIVSLLSLIFPIYQLIAINRRWFSWVGLALGILSVLGCLYMTIVTLSGM